MTTRRQLSGMTCASRVRHVETPLKNVPGVETVRVELKGETATVESSPDVAALIAAVEDEGYGARVLGA